MGGKAKYRCRLGMLKVSKLRHSDLNVMKLENYGPKRECLNNNHKNSQKLYFFCFSQYLWRYKMYKNGRPHFGILIKNKINIIYFDIFFCQIKKLTNFICE